MRVYLDTNVYSMAASLGDVEALHASCKRGGIQVLASAENLLEILAIPDDNDRRREMTALTRIASKFEQTPLSYRHAMEVLYELRRLRPQWVRSPVGYRKAKAFLAAHREGWRQARRGEVPPSEAFAAYRRDAESGIDRARQHQRGLKEFRKEDVGDAWFLAVGEGNAAAEPLERIDLTDADQAWRLDCLGVWQNAIIRKDPASRDYRDYLGPYLTDSALLDETSVVSFWLHEVDSLRMPLNRICGLATYFQLRHKIGHGNPLDGLHAGHLIDVDCFVTADRAFFAVCEAIGRVVNSVARIRLMNRAAASTVTELERALVDVCPEMERGGR